MFSEGFILLAYNFLTGISDSEYQIVLVVLYLFMCPSFTVR